jgi:hypothetical protein
MADVNIASVVPPFLSQFSARSVPFATGSGLTEDNANFYYDDLTNTLFVNRITAGGLTPVPPVTVAGGGTGLTSYVAGDLIVATGPTTLARLPSEVSGTVFVSNGVGALPFWSPNLAITRLTATSDISVGVNPATSGQVRLPWVTNMLVRNGTNTANLNLIATGTGYLVFGESSIPLQINTNFTIVGTDASPGGVALKPVGNLLQVRTPNDADYATLHAKTVYADANFLFKDGQPAPAAVFGYAYMYIDVADGDLKIRFGDGVTKTIVVDT